MLVYPAPRSLSRTFLAPRPSRILDDSFERFFANAVTPPSVRTPRLDVSETDASYLVVFEVPGVTREQLKVSVEGRRVSIESHELPTPAAEGDAPKSDAAASPRALYRERSAVRYARAVSLPTEVDQAASQARFENGLLTLMLAKKVPAGATQLEIA